MNTNQFLGKPSRSNLPVSVIGASALAAALTLAACGPQSGASNVAGTAVPAVSQQGSPMAAGNGIQPNGQPPLAQSNVVPQGQVVASTGPNSAQPGYAPTGAAYQAPGNSRQQSDARPQPYANQAQDEVAPPTRVTAPTKSAAPAVASAHLGEVRSIEPIRERPKGNGTGAVIGGLLGAVVGNQFGHGGGRAVTTVLGAAGGAVAGNNLERNHREGIVGYRVSVRLDNGTSRTFQEADASEFRVGDRVRIDRGQLRPV